MLFLSERDELFKKSLAKLREDIVKANTLVREANFLAEEMGKNTEFGVTLQIPAANLSPNRKRGAFVSETAILVKRKGKPSQIWSMDKLENKLIDMREMYTDWREKGVSVKGGVVYAKGVDPFYESQENHNLIGVANVFLEVLFHDVRLNYHVPIISQQGEVAGRLQVEICRIDGQLNDRVNETSSEGSGGSSINGSIPDVSDDSTPAGNYITCRVTIKQATGLPPSLSNFVFCQYTFWGYHEPIAVAPIVNPEAALECRTKDSLTFKFDHTKEFRVNVNEEFIEHCTEGALSIEVWGNRSAGFGSSQSAWEVGDPKAAHSRSLADRWSELKRKIELRVEILELNDQGDYSPVEVMMKPDVLTGGIYQLRQGQQRRILVTVTPVQNSGTLPIICESISYVEIGSVCCRSKLQKGLDSYQEEDLTLLREKWSDCLMRRREYLDDQIQKMFKKQEKSEQDAEREQSLIDQWVCLTEERNAVMVPAPGSGIPGAPVDGDSPPAVEKHTPVLFLDLNADDLSMINTSGEGIPVAGANSILPKEQNGQLFSLPIVKSCTKDVSVTVAWDSSIHDSIYLNRVTPTEERVYLILKSSVHLSHPATMELVLRKRLCVNVYKKQSLTEKLRRKMIRQETLSHTSVVYEVVSNIPKASEELEDRESLAQMAASGEDGNDFDGESYIEKYTRGVSAVESILTLDRLRQDVAIKELLAAQGRPLRKTASVPNISNFMKAEGIPVRLDEQFHAESLSDLNSDIDKLRQRSKTMQPETRPQSNSFGLMTSPQPTKFIKPMRTLLEEQYHRERTPLLPTGNEQKALDQDEIGTPSEEYKKQRATTPSGITDDEEFSEFESYPVGTTELTKPAEEEYGSSRVAVVHRQSGNGPTVSSETYGDLQSSKAAGTPSMVSSGYGSQAVSSTTLSSDDSMSIRSISVDETPDSEAAKIFKDVQADRAKVKGDNSDAEASPASESKRMDASAAFEAHSSMVALADDVQAKGNGVYEDLALATARSDETGEVCPSNESFFSTPDPLILPPPPPFSNPSTTTTTPPLPAPLTSSRGPTTTAGVTKRERPAILRQNASHHRASYPSSRVVLSQEQLSRPPPVLDGSFGLAPEDGLESQLGTFYHNSVCGSSDSNGDDNASVGSYGSGVDLNRLADVSLPDWVVKGESVLIRPYNSSGVIAFIGATEFASGVWIGVELDAPTGKNDGTVNGVRYFLCRPRHGIFVRADKLILDKRGRGMKSRQNNAYSRSKTEGLSCSLIDMSFESGSRPGRSRGESPSVVVGNAGLRRSKSRGEGLADVSQFHSSSSFPASSAHGAGGQK